MIKAIGKILEVDYTLFGAPLVEVPNSEPKHGMYKRAKLPLEFSYNSYWNISFNCLKCASTVSIEDSQAKNYILVDKLFTRFYSGKLLDELSEVFDGVKVFKPSTSEYSFLTLHDFNDANAIDLFIPQIEFGYVSCPKCGAEFLCRFRLGFPMPPDPSMPQGLLGKAFIDEIIQVASDEGKSFKEILEENKLKPV